MSTIQLKGFPPEATRIVEELSRIHGPIRISHESSGTHLNLAAPCCLEEDGMVELQPSKRHLSINLDKYFGLGAHRVGHKTARKYNDGCASCMKHRKPYLLQDLLEMPTIEKRGYTYKDRNVTNQSEAYLIQDAKGNLVPDHPGTVVPLIALPKSHPCIQYLTARNFTALQAWRFCRASFCTMASPEGKLTDHKGVEHQRFYRRMAGGTKDTPWGRLILYVDIDGIQQGWQARILEEIRPNEEGTESLWHFIPINDTEPEWTQVARRASPAAKWEFHEALQDPDYPYSPSKYRNAGGQKRNEVMMGLDAAVRMNAGNAKPFCVLVEGPTDALRLHAAGVPAIAVMGKYLSQKQADMLAAKFKLVYVVLDNDKAGRASAPSFITALKDRNVDVRESPIPDKYDVKDAGELTPDQAVEFARATFPDFRSAPPKKKSVYSQYP